ncbi:MAG: imelysin family protein [Myxococcota bacterium]
MNRVLLAFVLLSCSDGGTTDNFDRSAMLQSMTDTVFLPTYQDFVVQTEALQQTTEAFCAAPDEAGFAALRDAFGAAKAPLKQAEPFSFGPHTDNPLRLGPTVDFWPARTPTVDDVLADSAPLSVEALDGMGSGAKGFPALGYLLFSPDDPLAALQAEPRRCEYALALTAHLHRQAGEYVDAWASEGGDHGGALVNGTTPYRSVFAAASVVFDQMVFTIENVRELKVGKPQGRRNDRVPDLTLLEAPFSERSLGDAIDALRGVRNVYSGDFNGVDGVGIRDWLLSRRPELDPQVTEGIDTAIARLEALEPTSLGDAITMAPGDVDAAYDAIRDLQRFLSTEVAGALSVTVTFNPTDGD